MSRNRYICLIWSLPIVFFLLSSLFAQDRESLAQLYSQHRILDLKQLNESHSIPFEDWKQFINTLFVTEADDAIQKFSDIYTRTEDTRLQQFIRQRIADYYAARGIYGTAEKIERDELFFEHDILPRWTGKRSLQFGVQLGAFSTKENARRVKDEFSKDYPNTRIIEKIRSGRKLFIVLIGGYSTRSEAERVARILNHKFQKEKYFTVQY